MEVVPKSEAKFSLSTSLLTVTSCLASARLGLFDCLATSGSILFFSINYWRRPVYGWRRNLDIINTVTCLIYQLSICHVVEAQVLSAYLFFTALGLGSFVVGRSLPGMRGTVAHSGVHVFGNIANMILYPGLVKARGLEPPPVDRAEIVLAILVSAAAFDVVFIRDWPPKWWPPVEDI